jgi:hypothetical protein
MHIKPATLIALLPYLTALTSALPTNPGATGLEAQSDSNCIDTCACTDPSSWSDEQTIECLSALRVKRQSEGDDENDDDDSFDDDAGFDMSDEPPSEDAGEDGESFADNEKRAVAPPEPATTLATNTVTMPTIAAVPTGSSSDSAPAHPHLPSWLDKVRVPLRLAPKYLKMSGGFEDHEKRSVSVAAAAAQMQEASNNAMKMVRSGPPTSTTFKADGPARTQ